MNRGELKASEFLTFLLAGNATLTVESRSGKRFTYKVTAKKDSTSVFWVKVLSGPDNCQDYRFIGVLSNGRFYPKNISPMAPSVKGFRWLIETRPDRIEEQARLYHEGRCGRCGRKLTVPESVSSGFGPECRERL